MSCALEPGLGMVTLPSGSVTVDSDAPGDATTYTLTCQGAGGPVSADVTVTTSRVAQNAQNPVSTATAVAALSGVNVITGDLTIDGAADLVDTDELDGLVHVEGNLRIERNAGLTSLALPYLEEVDGDLIINDNAALASLDLSSLSHVGGKLYISRNHALPPSEIAEVVTTVNGADGVDGPILRYYNDGNDVLSSMDQIFLCQCPGCGAGLFPMTINGGNWTLTDSSGIVTYDYGTYTVQGEDLTFSSLSSGNNQTTETEFEYDLLASFVAPGLPLCHAAGLPVGTGFATARTYTCPTYTGDTAEERNTFAILPNGEARWDFTAVVGLEQTTVTSYGVYVLEGDAVYFAFADFLTGIRFPTGIFGVGQSTLTVDQLPEEGGPCTQN
jgi:hypothetical protein